MASNENLALSDVGRALASGYVEDGLQRAQSRHSHPHRLENEPVSQARADGGRDAWLFLAGCFCIEALTWGECINLLQLSFASMSQEHSYGHGPVLQRTCGPRPFFHTMSLSTTMSVSYTLAIVTFVVRIFVGSCGSPTVKPAVSIFITSRRIFQYRLACPGAKFWSDVQLRWLLYEKNVVTMILNISQDSLSLSVYFKNTTARMPHSRKNIPASLSLALRQWYGFFAIDICYLISLRC